VQLGQYLKVSGGHQRPIDGYQKRLDSSPTPHDKKKEDEAHGQ